MEITVTPGNVDDRKPLMQWDGLFGKLFADKGYLGQKITGFLKEKGVELITRVRRNMKPVIHSIIEV